MKTDHQRAVREPHAQRRWTVTLRRFRKMHGPRSQGFARRSRPPRPKPPRSSVTRSRPSSIKECWWPSQRSEGHCGFYIMSEKVLRAHAAELKEYELNKASIRFPASKPLPAALVTKLVKARIAENEARQVGKKDPT